MDVGKIYRQYRTAYNVNHFVCLVNRPDGTDCGIHQGCRNAETSDDDIEEEDQVNADSARGREIEGSSHVAEHEYDVSAADSYAQSDSLELDGSTETDKQAVELQ